MYLHMYDKHILTCVLYVQSMRTHALRILYKGIHLRIRTSAYTPISRPIYLHTFVNTSVHKVKFNINRSKRTQTED